MPANPWKIISSREAYDNNWIRVSEFEVINPRGGKGIYGKVHFKNRAIGILPIDNQGNTFLVGQYRFAINAYSWEIPEGGGPLDEDPIDSAKRELKEETGIEARHWEKLMEIHLSNSVSDEYGHIYLATSLEFKDPEPEETELLTVKKLPFSEAYRMVLDGEITDSISVAAILRMQLLLQEKNKQES